MKLKELLYAIKSDHLIKVLGVGKDNYVYSDLMAVPAEYHGKTVDTFYVECEERGLAIFLDENDGEAEDLGDYVTIVIQVE